MVIQLQRTRNLIWDARTDHRILGPQDVNDEGTNEGSWHVEQAVKLSGSISPDRGYNRRTLLQHSSRRPQRESQNCE